MNFEGRRSGVLVLLLVVVLAAFSKMSAARPLSENFGGANEKSSPTYDSVYEIATQNLAFWLQRLSSGPSGSGPGH
ncbi:hypothetical protein Nepgr_022471 [Nepenthes gracilis]|uniref:Transmembrane protein n=1 Tax=Nepenthes gracilis TaxID=150966 RepID=A0AAD3SZK7_NEPGR|nr:hypothetical protein Nepgr_022471 [Nepenthes gracilis]